MEVASKDKLFFQNISFEIFSIEVPFAEVTRMKEE